LTFSFFLFAENKKFGLKKGFANKPTMKKDRLTFHPTAYDQMTALKRKFTKFLTKLNLFKVSLHGLSYVKGSLRE
jgi:hypothetical protein